LQIYSGLKDRFASNATLSIDYRLYNLKQLAYLIKDNEAAIQAAVLQDLDKGAFDVSFSDVCLRVECRSLPQILVGEADGNSCGQS
jgi:hypothetical protein